MLNSFTLKRGQVDREDADNQPELLATIAFEGPFVPYAGITSVISQSGGPLAEAAPVPSVTILPYHHHIIDTGENVPSCIGTVDVTYDDRPVAVEILRVDQTFFLRPTDERFFAGETHPYDMSTADLLRDSLFFGSSVAKSLAVIAAAFGKSDAAWALVCHDWEAAACALALARETQHRIALVLHNVYDGALTDVGLTSATLLRAGIDPQTCPGPGHLATPTVLERALELSTVKRTVFAVSSQFASDILDDVYLGETLAPHLRELLRGRLRGNDNGLFAPLKIPAHALAAAAHGNYEPLRTWKASGKVEFFAALRNHQPTEKQPIWGDRESFISADSRETVWFVTGGRDDPRQRGHDVLAAAVPDCLAHAPNARFLFFVMPGDEGLQGMAFLERLAQRYPEQVLVLPFRFAAGFIPALRSATWAVMPSLYGPFESANEFYLLGGVPGIARACGGLIEQIIPLRSAGSFSYAVQSRVEHWHTTSAEPTGILYRESDDMADAKADWIEINAANDGKLTNGDDRLTLRRPLPLFRAMVRQLTLALDDGIRVSQDEDLYYRMIVAGVDYLRRTFSWERNAQELVQLLFD